MAYRIYSKVDAGEVEKVLVFDEDYEDNDTTQKKEYPVGAVVKIKHEKEKYNGKICVVVHSAYGSHRVEPFNNSYVNNPAHLTKWGLFNSDELVKVKKPKGASTEYVPESGENNTIPMTEFIERNRLEELESKKRKSEEDNDELARLRKMFSGGSQLITKAKKKGGK